MSRPSSSDDLRSATPLRYAQQFDSSEPLDLESGGRLAELSVCYETWGELDARGENAVLVCHAISGDSHVTRHDEQDDPGWWELLVGPGKAIDTNRYFVICSNLLGGCRGTTGPNFVDPASGRPYGADFPVVTVRDMVEVQKRLLDHLGIGSLRAAVGGSLGGLQVLQWAVDHPERVRTAIVVAAAPRLSSQGIAFDVVGRNAIRHDPCFAGGQYYDGPAPESGLALARMLAHITYLSDQSMRAKFDPTRLQPRAVETGFESTFSVGSYLAHQGSRFVERFDANSYITLSTAMDLFDLGETPEMIQASLAPATCRWLFVSFSSDWLFTASASSQMVDALVAQSKSVSACVVDSPAGHDSFLLEDNMQQCSRMIGAAIEGLADGDRSRDGSGGENGEPPAGVSHASHVDEPTSIFYAHRLDYEMILRLMPQDASVVDLGCGNGELLSILRDRGHAPLLGMDRDLEDVVGCVGRGLDAIHIDLEEGLGAIPDQCFDVALLSQTLQSIIDVGGVLRELVRVGRRGIVSFPNFAYKPLREMFATEGRLPKEEGLYAYEWHDTPNRRFPSILDFQELCAKLDIQILDAIYIDSNAGKEIDTEPNLYADIAVVALARS